MCRRRELSMRFMSRRTLPQTFIIAGQKKD
jgi:hypothetical protein